ncbi:HlyU family transcriptional regulator [Pseudovibrio ascidiaceicola]|jgi:hypothetical protein|uniref:Transcriptional activator HlyU n=1 Tax=Pseudovibrio ascidiaceicola TaxID=285279 RepID=A0A1I3XX39_9HYPH|nr:MULTISPECIES: HlyU family transcriptional regulator [Pseudovibrio]KZK80556.1 Transcriptional activator HlyU [Pseudovibrio sp. Ad13]KZK97477.1 Transcriptional activator HlyU [Pseudovibrio sp. W74]KZL04817.1 Transcriptional activator HlyU [Pseudovibrio sp. Ad14]KZL22471.1 Transcriptional activator HlyU [Pseudovibrio sp. WM33]SFK24062.1 hypothetical protein SAMN04488518_103205 [Pseudovibrio ascidiaceicola]
MGFFSNLFGGNKDEKSTPAAKAEEFEGYLIYSEPSRRGGQWQTAGRITKQFGEETKEHTFIRADTHGSEDEAKEFSSRKAKQIIKEMGDGMFT